MTTPQPDSALPATGAARNSLIAGLIGIVLMAIYMLTPAGSFLLYGGMFFGLVGVVLGIVALTKRQAKGIAITGIITGAFAFLFGLAVVLFALAFVGAILA